MKQGHRPVHALLHRDQTESATDHHEKASIHREPPHEVCILLSINPSWFECIEGQPTLEQGPVGRFLAPCGHERDVQGRFLVG